MNKKKALININLEIIIFLFYKLKKKTQIFQLTKRLRI